jgi:hypothetical protein
MGNLWSIGGLIFWIVQLIAWAKHNKKLESRGVYFSLSQSLGVGIPIIALINTVIAAAAVNMYLGKWN